MSRSAVARLALGGALALAGSAVALELGGFDAGRALSALARGAAGDAARIEVTLRRSAPLLLAGLAVAVAFRAGLWNIGAEGQLLAGALAATWIGTRPWLPEAPGGAALALLAAGVAGAGWALLAGALRAGRGVPEVIATLLLTFVAYELRSWLVLGPLREAARRYPQSEAVAEAARLGRLGLVPAALAIGVAAAAALHWLVHATRAGLVLRAVGANPRFARAQGIAVGAATLAAMGLSGALAGLAGAGEVLGTIHRLYEGYAPGHGFAAIAVALLARLEPLRVVPAALLFGALQAGSEAMQLEAQVPAVVSLGLQAAVVLGSVVAAARREQASR